MAYSPTTVVIVNWNGGELLIRCLDHLTRQTLMPARILVMDNGSTDGSAVRAARVDRAEVHLLGANLGFAAANNRALDIVDTELVALLNPDALAESGWLRALAAAAKTHPDAASFASRQMLHGSPGILDGAGDVYHASGLIWRRGHGQALRPDLLVGREIFAACAAAALYRTAALRAVGGFDESFFCYAEDVDLGFRLRLNGHRCRYVPEAVVDHVGGASSGGRRSDFAVYHGHRNLVWTFVKDMPGILFWVLLPIHVLLNLLTVLGFSIGGHARVVMRAKRDAICGLPRAWRARRKVQSTRAASVREIWSSLDKGWRRSGGA